MVRRARYWASISGANDDVPGGGVEVVSVSPGGAAERAGLKAGDVLTEINGKALKGERRRVGARAAADRDAQGEARRLRRAELPARQQSGQGQPGRAAAEGPLLHDGGSADRGHRGPMPRMPNFMFMRGEGVFGSAELVPMTPKLGQYFGTETGLLVVRAPDDSRLKLEDGDVIVDIDGRTPSSPSHALRILSSYQPGEKLKLNILRTKKRMSFEITVPENARGRSASTARASSAACATRLRPRLRCAGIRRCLGRPASAWKDPARLPCRRRRCPTSPCSLPCAPNAARRLRLRPA